MKYTYAGDANLDGQIDAGDYGIIDNFVQVVGASGYGNGDFNYDGFIDAGDYGIIDNNIQAQGPPISPSVDPRNEPWSVAGEDASPAYTGSSDDIENEEDEALVESAMREASGEHASTLPDAVKLSHARQGSGGSINRGR